MARGSDGKYIPRIPAPRKTPAQPKPPPVTQVKKPR